MRARATDGPPGRGARLAHRPLPLPGAAPRRVRGAGPRRTGRTTASRSTRRRCPGSSAELGPEWAGLSLTMPLKRAVIPLLDEISETAASVEAVNTVVFTEDGRRLGDNTDIPGMVAALRERGDRAGGLRRRSSAPVPPPPPRSPRSRGSAPARSSRTCAARPAPPRCGSGASGSTSRCVRRTGRTRPGAARAAGDRHHPGGATDALAAAVPGRARHALRRAVRPVADRARRPLVARTAAPSSAASTCWCTRRCSRWSR